MALKKFFKLSIFLIAFSLSISLNTNAIKPTPEQLESFYSPFESLCTSPIISQYPNIKYLSGLDILEEEVGHKFRYIVNALKCPEDFETSEEYATHLLSYRINTGKILELDKQISRLKNFILREATIISPDTAHLLTFYEDLSAVLSTDDCSKFIEMAEQFVEKWTTNIRANIISVGEVTLDPSNDSFSRARVAAKENIKMFLKQNNLK